MGAYAGGGVLMSEVPLYRALTLRKIVQRWFRVQMTPLVVQRVQ